MMIATQQLQQWRALGEIADSFGIDSADAAFIAAAREAVPALLAEVERLC